ncbi:Ribonuclease P protein component [Buchnera aphidicola (Periphyllus testudinaceus)]|uniref:ribonuclease P protein component n=1 Tax=Buchnera aphidicola TaxID=9 RepID=UPI0034640A97
MIKFFFKKKFRLLNSIQYKYVFKNPYKVQFKKILILGKKNKMKYPRLGISISKKNVKKSVDRNYIKRLIREFFRIYRNKFFMMDFIVIVKKKIYKNKKKIFLNKLKYLWSRYFF